MKHTLYICITLALLLTSCGEKSQPKPYGYFRITLPDVSYNLSDSLGPYSVEISRHCTPNKSDAHWSTPADKWINLFYPQLNATIHLSYKHITPAQLQTVTEESRTLVYKHTIRADAIKESYYEDPDRKIYCIFYELTGNAASPTQFYATDSVHNFLRGAVYFNNIPNYDSIAPAARYVENDVVHIIETLKWNN